MSHNAKPKTILHDIQPNPTSVIVHIDDASRMPSVRHHPLRQLRELLSSNQELAKRLDQFEARIEKKLTSHDDAIAAMLSAIRELMHPPPAKRRGIGFTADISNPK